MVPLTWGHRGLRIGTFIETKSRIEVSKGWAAGKWELSFTGYKVSVQRLKGSWNGEWR